MTISTGCDRTCNHRSLQTGGYALKTGSFYYNLEKMFNSLKPQEPKFRSTAQKPLISLNKGRRHPGRETHPLHPSRTPKPCNNAEGLSLFLFSFSLHKFLRASLPDGFHLRGRNSSLRQKLTLFHMHPSLKSLNNTYIPGLRTAAKCEACTCLGHATAWHIQEAFDPFEKGVSTLGKTW